MERKVQVQEVTVRSSNPLNLFIAIMVAAQMCYERTGKFSGMLVMETTRKSPREVIIRFIKASDIR